MNGVKKFHRCDDELTYKQPLALTFACYKTLCCFIAPCKDKGIKPIDDENFPYAYIVDRNGPDCIQSGINLRVPEGRYSVSWHNYGIRANTLQIYNNFVPFARSILIHNGHTPKDSEGCMLINDYVVDKFDDIVFQNEQEGETKEHRLAKSLKKDFTKEILGKRRWQLVE